jgi:hypothetical protein
MVRIRKKAGEGENNKIRKQFELLLNLSGFLGGLTFAAMVFVMQAQENFIFQNLSYYPDILITSLAGISFTLIFSSLIQVDAVTGLESPKSKLSQLSMDMALLAWFSVLVIIRFIVLPFSLIGGVILGILEIGVTIRFITIPAEPA